MILPPHFLKLSRLEGQVRMLEGLSDSATEASWVVKREAFQDGEYTTYLNQLWILGRMNVS